MSYPRRTWTGSGSRSPRERPSRGGSGTLSTLSSGTLSGAVGTVGAVPAYMATTSSWSQRTKSPGGALPSHGHSGHSSHSVHAPPRLGRSASLQSLPASLGSKSTGPERRGRNIDPLNFSDDKSEVMSSIPGTLGTLGTLGRPSWDELQLVQQRLAERFVKLDEGLRSKDLQLEDFGRSVEPRESNWTVQFELLTPIDLTSVILRILVPLLLLLPDLIGMEQWRGVRDLTKRYAELAAKNADAMRRAEAAEEEVLVLRKALAQSTEELQRLKRRENRGLSDS
ncbi:unnamed protein product [Cladocopium goreaui]|uniref:Uncharacterized protein n=1 Tax=Cladocopium goreaui TaxID=2562237 RepID=A0A9P1C4F0_9DINO|nr:unnamed protein product [Cladocopium goreaui]